MSNDGSFLLPADWSTHRSTTILWPGRADVWDPHMEEGRLEVARLAELLARSELVHLVVDPRMAHTVPSTLRPSVQCIVMPIDDAWARDTCPLSVFDTTGREVAVSFRFNSWGRKFMPYDSDALIGRRLASEFDLPFVSSPLVLEGGAIAVDGEGTALIVERSVLNRNRNAGVDKATVERALFELLGVDVVVWFEHGLLDDVDTDGHVDNVAAFTGPAQVVCQVAGRDREDERGLLENLRRLQRARDAQGRQFEVIELPWLPYSPLGASRPAPYVNFYFFNDGLAVPVVGAPSDDLALDLFQGLTSRRVTAICARALGYGGGGVHCVTQPRFILADDAQVERTADEQND